MIFVRDKGRMCNNILQYGHLYAWAREHGRRSMSMRFAYKYPWFHICDTPYHNPIVYALAKFCAWARLLPVVSFDDPEKAMRPDDTELLRHRHVVAQGWNVLYPELFLKYKQEIVSLFAFHDDIYNKVKAILSQDGAEVRVGLHVRRGDYKTWNGGKFYLTDDEFIRAALRMRDLLPGKRIHFYVCGNDPELNQAAYEEALGKDCVSFPQGNPAEDLCLLSQMDYLMGPPSTFTFVASMYRNVPLHRIRRSEPPFALADFQPFDEIFTDLPR